MNTEIKDLAEVCSILKKNNTFTVFDLETTGSSKEKNQITEIGAIKIHNGKIISSYDKLINPNTTIPPFISNLTGITDEMVKDKPFIEEIICDFLNYVGDSVLVAHNARFDVGFINYTSKKLLETEVKNKVIDTLSMSRNALNDIRNHKLDTLAEYFKVSLKNHHRACDDAKATAEIFLKLSQIYMNNYHKANKLHMQISLEGGI